ncbi:RNA polymerase sigma-70 factor [Coprobacter tertius]|uniref:RNA polymerase sigma-70 factor n=1 Tax=Coprobacter tertius TaxID=2944915 RepID=A0ABT1MML7_9BACT|nr:RNA polymerase sigma-70 factor [Coprobacter tertius]MCP9612516.1 RNA polymerase sigma-70 factor [Coprobacter tertius]
MTDFSNDIELLKEIRLGNEMAFSYLFRYYYPRLRGYASRFIDDEETVRDIIQECFLKLWEKREILSAISVTSLLFAMVRNGCINYLKHVSVVEKHRIEYLARIDGEERLYYADFVFDPDNNLLYNELQDQIKLVIGQLPGRCREVFLLSRFSGLKNKEIAEKLQISLTAVEKHITKALCIFSKHFKDKYPVDIYIIIIAWLIYGK